MILRLHLLVAAGLLAVLTVGPAVAADACYTASKTYQIRPLHGGPSKRDAWIVRGDEFARCVRRAEAADKTLRARYPEAVYSLSLAATIGCHSPCD